MSIRLCIIVNDKMAKRDAGTDAARNWRRRAASPSANSPSSRKLSDLGGQLPDKVPKTRVAAGGTGSEALPKCPILMIFSRRSRNTLLSPALMSSPAQRMFIQK